MKQERLSKRELEKRVKELRRLFVSNTRYLMKQRGWKEQKELADASGVKQSSISRYLSGKVVPAWPELVKIAHMFGVTISTLLTRDLASEPFQDPEGNEIASEFEVPKKHKKRALSVLRVSSQSKGGISWL